nr:hypothetical protein HmN_001000900 [Hymenolepis microstoma]
MSRTSKSGIEHRLGSRGFRRIRTTLTRRHRHQHNDPYRNIRLLLHPTASLLGHLDLLLLFTLFRGRRRRRRRRSTSLSTGELLTDINSLRSTNSSDNYYVILSTCSGSPAATANSLNPSSVVNSDHHNDSNNPDDNDNDN